MVADPTPCAEAAGVKPARSMIAIKLDIADLRICLSSFCGITVKEHASKKRYFRGVTKWAS
jgi:hypothetical protein